MKNSKLKNIIRRTINESQLLLERPCFSNEEARCATRETWCCGITGNSVKYNMGCMAADGAGVNEEECYSRCSEVGLGEGRCGKTGGSGTGLLDTDRASEDNFENEYLGTTVRGDRRLNESQLLTEEPASCSSHHNRNKDGHSTPGSCDENRWECGAGNTCSYNSMWGKMTCGAIGDCNSRISDNPIERVPDRRLHESQLLMEKRVCKWWWKKSGSKCENRRRQQAWNCGVEGGWEAVDPNSQMGCGYGHDYSTGGGDDDIEMTKDIRLNESQLLLEGPCGGRCEGQMQACCATENGQSQGYSVSKTCQASLQGHDCVGDCTIGGAVPNGSEGACGMTSPAGDDFDEDYLEDSWGDSKPKPSNPFKSRVNESHLNRIVKRVINEEAQLLTEAPFACPSNPLSWNLGPGWVMEVQLDPNVWMDVSGNGQLFNIDFSGGRYICKLTYTFSVVPGGGEDEGLYSDDELETYHTGGGDCKKEMSCADGYLWSWEHCNCMWVAEGYGATYHPTMREARRYDHIHESQLLLERACFSNEKARCRSRSTSCCNEAMGSTHKVWMGCKAADGAGVNEETCTSRCGSYGLSEGACGSKVVGTGTAIDVRDLEGEMVHTDMGDRERIQNRRLHESQKQLLNEERPECCRRGGGDAQNCCKHFTGECACKNTKYKYFHRGCCMQWGLNPDSVTSGGRDNMAMDSMRLNESQLLREYKECSCGEDGGTPHHEHCNLGGGKTGKCQCNGVVKVGSCKAGGMISHGGGTNPWIKTNYTKSGHPCCPDHACCTSHPDPPGPFNMLSTKGSGFKDSQGISDRRRKMEKRQMMMKESGLNRVIKKSIKESQLINESAACGSRLYAACGEDGDCSGEMRDFVHEYGGPGTSVEAGSRTFCMCHIGNGEYNNGSEEGCSTVPTTTGTGYEDFEIGGKPQNTGRGDKAIDSLRLKESQVRNIIRRTLNENIVCKTHQECKDASGDDRQKCDKGAGECYVPAGSGPPHTPHDPWRNYGDYGALTLRLRSMGMTD